MDAITKRTGEDEELELNTELELWDWARSAGVSVDDLRQTLRALLSTTDLRKAA
jgi:hypothetical protein